MLDKQHKVMQNINIDNNERKTYHYCHGIIVRSGHVEKIREMFSKMPRPKLLSFVLFLNIFVSCCAYGSDSMTYDEKLEAIQSLKSYEILEKQQAPQNKVSQTTSSGSNQALAGAANSPTLASKIEIKKITEFVCVDESEHSCEMQEFLYSLENRQSPQFKSDGKYRIGIYFKNDADFPRKYRSQNSFESLSKADDLSMKTKIFKHYVGEDYEHYNPTVITVDEITTGLIIYVANAEELERFLDDVRIEAISHIGNNNILQQSY